MKPVTQELLRQAAAAFDFGLPTGEAERYGAGHINDTFAVWAADHSRRWILQRINTDTFTDPAGLMENVTGVTSYLRREILARGGDPYRETLNVVPTREGKPYYTDCEGGAWRAYLFVEGTVCLQKVENERDFYTAAETFGNFQNQLAGYPAATLHETIARFHDTPNRYANFEKALAADVMGRAREIGPEIAFIRAREADCHVLMDQLAAGVLPLRVTHNDTKLNNVMLDYDTHEALCVIDLDTIMPGSALYDYGDSIRFGAATAAEDERDFGRMGLDLELFRTYTRGFLSACGDSLTERELRMLPVGARLMTLECGVRFLTDYLSGDTYFKISREGHNLDRARTQLRLVEDMERKWKEMEQIVKEVRA